LFANIYLCSVTYVCKTWNGQEISHLSEMCNRTESTDPVMGNVMEKPCRRKLLNSHLCQGISRCLESNVIKVAET